MRTTAQPTTWWPFAGQDLVNSHSQADFIGAAPNLFTMTDPRTGRRQQAVGIGQKSGDYWALNPDTGAVVWRTTVGPGGLGGGDEFATATDGGRVYVAEANSGQQAYTLSGSGPFAGQTVTSGNWSALNPGTGAVHGMLFWGSGYTRNAACPDGFNSCVANNKLFAFGLP